MKVKIRKESLFLLLLGIIVYLPFMAGQLNNADGFTNGVLYHGDGYGWEDAQGRFFLRFFDYWRDSMIVPELIVFVSVLMMLVMIYLVWETLDITNFLERVLIGGFILFAPSIANLFTYYYCADAYSLGFLLAVAAAYVLIKGKKSFFWLPIVLLIVSMGIYQTYVGATISLVVIWVIKEILRNEIEVKELISRIAYSVSVVVGGAVGYLGIFKLLEKIGYLSPTGTRGMDNMLGNMFTQLLDMIRVAYQVFQQYFFQDSIINNSWRFRKYFNIAICVATIFLILYLFYRRKVYCSIIKMIVLLGAILVFPAMLTIIVILAPGASVYAETGMLMLPYMNLLYVLPLTLLELVGHEKKTSMIKVPFYLLSTILLMIMVVFIGVFIRTIELEQAKVQALAYQMENRIESIPGYTSGMKVLVVGRPHSGNYPFADEKMHDITKGMISRYSLTFGGADQVSASWIKLFQYYCGVNYTECETAEREAIMTSLEFEEMGNFPESTAVKKINDIVVIRFNWADVK